MCCVCIEKESKEESHNIQFCREEFLPHPTFECTDKNNQLRNQFFRLSCEWRRKRRRICAAADELIDTDGATEERERSREQQRHS